MRRWVLKRRQDGDDGEVVVKGIKKREMLVEWWATQQTVQWTVERGDAGSDERVEAGLTTRRANDSETKLDNENIELKMI